MILILKLPENLLVGDGAGPGRGEGHRPVEHEQCVQGGQFVVLQYQDVEWGHCPVEHKQCVQGGQFVEGERKEVIYRNALASQFDIMMAIMITRIIIIVIMIIIKK